MCIPWQSMVSKTLKDWWQEDKCCCKKEGLNHFCRIMMDSIQFKNLSDQCALLNVFWGHKLKRRLTTTEKTKNTTICQPLPSRHLRVTCSLGICFYIVLHCQELSSTLTPFFSPRGMREKIKTVKVRTLLGWDKDRVTGNAAVGKTIFFVSSVIFLLTHPLLMQQPSPDIKDFQEL